LKEEKLDTCITGEKRQIKEEEINKELKKYQCPGFICCYVPEKGTCLYGRPDVDFNCGVDLREKRGSARSARGAPPAIHGHYGKDSE
jgi:hypothetical protein